LNYVYNNQNIKIFLKYFFWYIYKVTQSEQTEHWLKFHRFALRYEIIYTPKFNAALKEQIDQYIEDGTLMAVNSTPIYGVLVDLYYNAAYIWAHRATNVLRVKSVERPMTLKERLTMGFSERIVELMRQYYGIDLLNLSDDITQTTKDTIQAVLEQAAIEGFGFDEVVRRLQLPDMTDKRARLIARTETVGAANAASNVAAQDSGLKMDKIWISARDNRVRFHHAEVNQHTVAMNDDFIVGGLPMSFPGDKRGGANNVCNCRCTHAFIPKRDSQGRLIRS